MATGHAQPQVDPTVTAFQALFAPSGMGLHILNLGGVFAVLHGCSIGKPSDHFYRNGREGRKGSAFVLAVENAYLDLICEICGNIDFPLRALGVLCGKALNVVATSSIIICHENSQAAACIPVRFFLHGHCICPEP